MVVEASVVPPITAAVAYRPVQYLGSKLRSLEAIRAVIAEMAPRAGVADPFSGTSVVGQALARGGHQVRASDALRSAATFARALLGVGRESLDLPAVLTAIKQPMDFSWFDAWNHWTDREARAIASRDGAELIAVSLDVPQVWRATAAGPLRRQLDWLAEHEGQSAVGLAPLAAGHYAGTYFGISQALELDAILQSISTLRMSGQIGPWVQAVLQTALLSAASEAAFSAGKHYAQPHAIHRAKDLEFARGRIVQDRSKQVRGAFERQAAKIVEAAAEVGAGHRVMQGTIEELSRRDWFRGVGVIYADPPYTAQQYSRFYHVPEVLLDYVVPQLDRVKGRLTQGLYPTGRFKSPYSSKRLAPAAFRDLCRTSAAAGAHLVISYSATASGLTGNDRMIGLDDLRAICEASFPRRVEVLPLEHAYRQFNGTGLAVTSREDPEFLIACHADTG